MSTAILSSVHLLDTLSNNKDISKGIDLQDSCTCMEIRGFAIRIFLLINDPEKDLQFSKTLKLLQI